MSYIAGGCRTTPKMTGSRRMALRELGLRISARGISALQQWRDEGALLLDAPYQRGHVWGPTRRVNLIRSLLMGIPIAALVINDRHTAGWAADVNMAVIDGKQRITTILMFLDDKLAVPGDWVDVPDTAVVYSQFPRGRQLDFRRSTLAVAHATMPDVDSERLVFELINFGGVPQGVSDGD